MRYWINRRARELSLRFMYSIDIDDQDSLDAIKNINLDINNFWDSNPVVNYYMLKKMIIAEKEMVVVGCSLLKSGKVFLRAAPAGTGIIAGGAIRSVCEVIGIQDVVAKSLGSANPHNVLKACLNGLKSQISPKILSNIRGKKISDIVLKREAK